MRIRSKFKIVIAVFMSMLILLCGIIYLTIRDLNRAMEKNRIAKEIVKDVFELNLVSHDYMRYQGERPKQQCEMKYVSLQWLLSNASRRFDGREERAMIEEMELIHGKMEDIFAQLVVNYEKDPGGEKNATLLEIEERLVTQLMVNSLGMVSKADLLNEMSRKEVETAQERINLLTIACIVLMCTIMITVAIWVTKGILGPIARFQEGTEIIGEGDLDHEIGINTNDEIGSLSRAFDNMLISLKEITASRDELNREINERRKAEEALRKAHDELEERVRERTAELTRANESLESEIAERKRAEAEKTELEMWLRQSQKLESIGTLASGVAHEINNPLMGIISYAELINEQMEDESLQEFSEGIIEEGKRVDRIVKNLLSFARQDKESHSPAYLSDIINVSLSLLGAVLRKNQITLEMDVPHDLPKVRCRTSR